MSNSHPKALRERVVEAYENGEGTQRELCERFKLSMTAVNAWVQLKRETGSVSPRPVKGGNASEITEEALKALLAQKNDLSYEEMAVLLQEQDIACSRSSVQRAMARFELTRKKKAVETPNKPSMKPNAKPSKPPLPARPDIFLSSSMKPGSGAT